MAAINEWVHSAFLYISLGLNLWKIPDETTQVDHDMEKNGDQQDAATTMEKETTQVDDMKNNAVTTPGSISAEEQWVVVVVKEEPNANHEVPQQASINLENELKFAFGLFTASAGGIVAAVIAGFKGTAGITHPVAFHAFASLNLAALISDSIAILLCLKCPKVSHLARIVQFALCVCLGSLIFADIWAVYILFNTK